MQKALVSRAGEPWQHYDTIKAKLLKQICPVNTGTEKDDCI